MLLLLLLSFLLLRFSLYEIVSCVRTADWVLALIWVSWHASRPAFLKILGEGGVSGGASLKMSTSTNASMMPVQNRMTRRERQLVKVRLEDRRGSQKMHVGESEIW
ncbi:unnamed protein product [Ixodes pacificus]